MNKILHCALCNEAHKSLAYNLKTTRTIYSNTPLIFLLDSVEKLCFFLLEICEGCYRLLNELDALNTQVREIHTRLKCYITRAKKQPLVNENFIAECKPTDMTYWNIKEENEPNPTNKSVIYSDKNTEFIAKDYEDGPPEPCKIDIDNRISVNDTNESKIENVLDHLDNLDENMPKIKIMKKHEKSSLSLKPHKCYCNKTFFTKKELKSHLLSHSQERPFICEICGQGYKRKFQFNVHMDMHNGKNQFTCVHCQKSFTQKVGLMRHAVIHTGEKSYQCEECGKRFGHRTSFTAHKFSHNGTKIHKCSYCSRSFMSSSHLRRHVRIHTGEKKYPCSTCGMCFAERYNLLSHEKLHLDAKSNDHLKSKFCCQICGESFWRKINLETHMMKKHFSVSPLL